MKPLPFFAMLLLGGLAACARPEPQTASEASASDSAGASVLSSQLASEAASSAAASLDGSKATLR